MYYNPYMYRPVRIPGEIYPYPYYGGGGYDRWIRSGTFAGMGNCACATPVDPRSAPVWSNTYRLATAGALNRVGSMMGLGSLDFGSAGVYLLALGVPVAVLATLFALGVIRFD
jgi:hypothetical protein